jgi:RHS repeat-associated protein
VEVELGYVRNLLALNFAVPFVGAEINSEGAESRAAQPMLCSIDQEVFCNPAQPVIATYNRGASRMYPAFTVDGTANALDWAIRYSRLQTVGFGLRSVEMGNECGAAQGTSAVNLHNGNLVLSYGMPGAGPADPPLRVYYNSIAHLEPSPYGRGWAELYYQWVEHAVAGSGSGSIERCWLTRLANPADKQWIIDRYDDGRIHQIIGPHGRTVTYVYRGRLLDRIIDAFGRETIFGIDAASGLLMSITDADQRVTRFGYNTNLQLDQWRNHAGDVTRFLYDPCYRLRAIITPENETTWFEYRDRPRKTRIVTDARGHRTTVTLDRDGNIAVVDAPEGVQTKYEWDGFQRLQTESDGRGNRTTLSYVRMQDLSRRLSRIQRPIGQAEFEYDVNDARVTAIVDPLRHRTTLTWERAHPGCYPGVVRRLTNAIGKIYTYTYNDAGQLRLLENPQREITEWVFDGEFRRIAEVNGEGERTTFAYDGLGRLSRIVNGEGETTTITRDRVNHITAVTDPNGHTNTMVFDDNGRLSKKINPLNRVWEQQYDLDGRPTAAIDPNMHVVRHRYDATSNRIATTSARNKTTTYVYDSLHRNIASINALGDTTTFVYDAADNPIQTIDPLQRTWTSTFDANNRLVTRIDPLVRVTTTIYDDYGDILGMVNPRGEGVMTTYDALHRTVTTEDALHLVTTYTYDDAGRLETIVDAELHLSSLVYDRVGRVKVSIDPRGSRTTYAYDRAGRQRSVTNADLEVAGTTYDRGGRPRTRIHARGTATTYTYYANDLVQTILDPLGRVTTFQYDAADRLIDQNAYDGHHSVMQYDEDDNLRVVVRGPAGTGTTSGTPLRAITTYTYDDLGRRVRTEGPEHASSGQHFDAVGRLIALSNAVDKRTTFTWDDADRMIATTTPLGIVMSYSYDDADRLEQVADGDRQTRQTIFDAAGRVQAAVDPMGRRTTLTHDKIGQLLAVEDPLGHVMSFTYDEVGNLATSMTPLGFTTTYTYTRTHRQRTVENPRRKLTTYTYDSAGMPKTVQTPTGTTTYAYDDLNRLKTEVNPEGHITTYVHDDRWDEIRAVTDPRGNTITLSYDDLGSLATRTVPLGPTDVGVTTLVYDAAKRLRTMVSAEGHVTTYLYNSLGSLTTLTNPESETTVFVFDDDGRRIARVTPLGHRWTSVYDGRGNLVQEENPLRFLTTHQYDANGRHTKTIDAELRTEEVVYDAAGRITCRIDGLGHRTTYTIDADGRMTGLIDAEGHITTFGYDGNANQTTVLNYRREYEVRVYDDGDRIQTSNKYGGVGGFLFWAATLTFDRIGRLTDQAELDIPKNDRRRYAHRYDPNDNLTLSESPDGVFLYGFDRGNRRISQQGPQSIEWRHDRDGRLVYQGVIGTNLVTTYVYDRADRETLRIVAGQRTTSVYDDDGNLFLLYPPPGRTGQSVYLSHTYDDASRLIRKVEIGAGGGIGETITYEYDKAGKLLLGPGSLVSYSYDDAGRLRTEIRSGTRPAWHELSVSQWRALDTDAWSVLPVSDPPYDVVFDYDGVGNIEVERVDGIISTFIYEDNHVSACIVAGQRHTFTYDEQGRRAAHEDPSHALTTYTWNATGHLRGVALPGGRAVTYTYDGHNLIQSRQTPGGVRKYVWAGNILLAETDAAGTPIAVYHTSAEGFGDVRAITDPATGDTAVPMYSHSGGVNRVYDGDQVRQSIVLRAYGEVVAVNDASGRQPTVTHNAQFGVFRDPETGLLYMRQRWYDPATKQFLSPDPSGIEAGSENPYLFAGADPVNHTDPEGLDFLERDANDIVHWQVETTWGRNTDRHSIGRYRNGNLYLWDTYGGGYLPYPLVAEAADNIQRHGYDLASVPFKLQQKQILSALNRLRRGEDLGRATGDETVAEAFFSGAYVGALTLADTFTFSKIDSLREATEREWQESGLAGTWVQTATTVSATFAREALIQAVTVGAGSALTAARGTKLATDAEKLSRLARNLNRGLNWAGSAISGSSRAARVGHTVITAVNWGGRAYGGVNTVIDTYDGYQQVKAGNPLGWLSIAGGALEGVGVAISGYGAIRRALRASGEAAATVPAHVRRAWEKIRSLFRRCSCFVAGTEVVTPEGLIAIEQLTVGRRVTTQTDSESRFERDPATPIDPRHWKRISLRLSDTEGHTDVVLLRPDVWLEVFGVVPGGTVDLSLPEMGVDGPAAVLAVEPCPDLQPGAPATTSIVTGTFAHHVARVVDLTLDGEAPIGVTLEHPFWSVDEGCWVPVKRLRTGSRVQLDGGIAMVQSIVLRDPPEPVYNLEVDGDHVYRVARQGVLVHNISVESLATDPFGVNYGTDVLSMKAIEHRIDEALKFREPASHWLAQGHGNVAVIEFRRTSTGPLEYIARANVSGGRHAERVALDAFEAAGHNKNWIERVYSEYSFCTDEPHMCRRLVDGFQRARGYFHFPWRGRRVNTKNNVIAEAVMKGLEAAGCPVRFFRGR